MRVTLPGKCLRKSSGLDSLKRYVLAKTYSLDSSIFRERKLSADAIVKIMLLVEKRTLEYAPSRLGILVPRVSGWKTAHVFNHRLEKNRSKKRIPILRPILIGEFIRVKTNTWIDVRLENEPFLCGQCCPFCSKAGMDEHDAHGKEIYRKRLARKQRRGTLCVMFAYRGEWQHTLNQW